VHTGCGPARWMAGITRSMQRTAAGSRIIAEQEQTGRS
jgi:hypothetical protein